MDTRTPEERRKARETMRREAHYLARALGWYKEMRKNGTFEASQNKQRRNRIKAKRILIKGYCPKCDAHTEYGNGPVNH